MCKVSVLMPVYNAEKYLAEAMDSIIQQTYKDWEFIIINDGSTDSTKSIIESYNDERIRYFENENNLGVIETLNRGIDYCKGKYIARMDSDDIAHPNRLIAQVEFMDAHPDYVMCGTNATIVDTNKQKIGNTRSIPFDEGIRIKLLFSNPFSHPSVMVRTDILQKQKYKKEWKHVEDYELWTRIVKTGKVANLKQHYLFYRWHGSNISNIQSEAQAELRNKITKSQLMELGISADDQDLVWHYYSFNPQNLKKGFEAKDSTYINISKWFNKLISQNEIYKIYSQDHLIAFLWSRWIVICKGQGNWLKIFSANFISFRPSVLKKLLQFLIAGIR